ncbi:MAG: cupin [Rhodospirillales bacterium 69-11]|nr:cupin domain-containing protein [Rhodospirillales bacterium]OJW25158.1 MAG: cupin [Rhodospirillales bacterium 69-11]
MDTEHASPFRSAQPGYRWDGVAHMPYKQDGSAPFKDISRQVLFDDPALACQLRYFEMDAGGHSTLERHEHAHAVMILRGHGHCLVGGEVRAIGPQDLVSIPAWAWHQFRATRGEAFGFLCMVNHLRDRPQIPTEDELAALRTDPTIRAFLDDAPLA